MMKIDHKFFHYNQEESKRIQPTTAKYKHKKYAKENGQSLKWEQAKR